MSYRLLVLVQGDQLLVYIVGLVGEVACYMCCRGEELWLVQKEKSGRIQFLKQGI